MSRRWNRRDFLLAAAGSVAALGLSPLPSLGRAEEERLRTGERRPRTGAGSLRTGEGRVRPDAGDLPPRTIGLRTTGGDFRFDPVGLAVEPGSELIWLNMGDFHTTTAFHPDNEGLLPGDVPTRIPEGAEPWHSGMLGMSAGTEYSYVFEVPGVYDYFCQPHYSFGMVGRVIALPGGAERPTARPASELNEASREQMPSVEAILGPGGRTYEWAARINGLLLLRAHDEDAGPAAEALARAARADDALDRVLGEESFFPKLDRLTAGVRSDRGYEKLLARADAAKEALAAARRSIG